jgi:hypothetical protein
MIKTNRMEKTIFYLCGFMLFIMTACNNGKAKSNDNTGLKCSEIQSWKNDDDIIKSIQGTWEMEHDDYYGKRKFQFNGKTGKSWVMEPNTNQWKEDGSLKFRYIEKYENATKMNQGPEYLMNFETELGSFTFEVNCVSGFFVPSDRFTYGVSLIKV